MICLGQALLIKAGGFQEQETNVPSLANACQILMKIRWPDGTVAKNIWVNCKDGNANYNYHTDDKGEVLFSTNSGSANVNITNILDQDTLILDAYSIGMINIDAPIGTVKRLNYTMNPIRSFRITNRNSSYGICASNVNNFSVSIMGGGGGGCSGSNGGDVGYGGGGAYANSGIIPGSAIKPLTKLSFAVGSGGRGGHINHRSSTADSGGSGGSTSFYGLLAYGGAGGSTTTPENNGKAARGGGRDTNYYNNSKKVSYGEAGINGGAGGGGGYISSGDSRQYSGGSPGGGSGASRWYNETSGGWVVGQASSGSNGGGGGVGPVSSITFSDWMSNSTKDDYYNGGNGGNGYINITENYI